MASASLSSTEAPRLSRSRLSNPGRSARGGDHSRRRRVGPEAVLGEPGAGAALVERVVDEAIAALCAEAVGAMAAMHELTVDYLKTRRHFGREIGSFQILQHRPSTC